MAAPTMTFNAAGNVRANATLTYGAPASYNLDYSNKVEGQVTVKNSPGLNLSTSRGVRVEFFPRYGSSVTDTSIPAYAYDMPSQSASPATESKTFFIGTGKWTVKVTQLDATYTTSVEITDATVDGMG